ncbi:hypothetical protein SteCoe_25736 [Stentor coeruleus]|uniref:Glutamine amidotransferase domain-containing protein n=1 Tax=Stentor coeruleus TaxID=5963 RepID=A0A1R2BEI5_9CILI|nr:hypothetical protein SteCoe_25736 [Stentor coeruleus]
MRVLLVNAYSETSEGKRSFNSFKSIILEAFTYQKMYNLSDIEFIEVDRHTIDSYLYEPASGYSNKDSEKLFDHLDFIFIEGEANILPWLRRARKFLILMRMCKNTRKIVFACNFAMQMLVFLCATNFNIERVVNGKGHGSSLKSLHNIDSDIMKRLTLGDVFIDNATGDIYCHDSHKDEFYPVANTGIHNHKAAQESAQVSEAMLKTRQYLAKIVDSANQIFIGKSNEDKCRVYKQYVQHWLVKGLGFSEFLIPSMNKWDVHPINATLKENVYMVLAESNRGPQIIIHNNAVSLQFHISNKYPATFLVLKNFVTHMMSRFQNEKEKMDLPLAAVTKMGVGMRLNYVGNSSSAASLFELGLKNNEAKHSGYAFSLRNGEPLTVKINATTSEAIRIRTAISGKLKSVDSFELEQSSDYSDYSNTIKKQKTNRKVEFAKRDTIKIKDNPILDERIVKPIESEYISSLGADYINSLPTAWKSKKEIRAMLHPGYPIQSMPKRGTVLNGTNLVLAKNDFAFYEKPLIKVIQLGRPYCRYNEEYKNKEVNTFEKTKTGHFSSNGPTIRNDGSPYLDPEKKYRRDQIMSKGKWVTERDFKRVFNAETEPVPQEFNSPSVPFHMHKFRDENPNNWLAGAFKTASY